MELSNDREQLVLDALLIFFDVLDQFFDLGFFLRTGNLQQGRRLFDRLGIVFCRGLGIFVRPVQHIPARFQHGRRECLLHRRNQFDALIGPLHGAHLILYLSCRIVGCAAHRQLNQDNEGKSHGNFDSDPHFQMSVPAFCLLLLLLYKKHAKSSLTKGVFGVLRS